MQQFIQIVLAGKWGAFLKVTEQTMKHSCFLSAETNDPWLAHSKQTPE